MLAKPWATVVASRHIGVHVARQRFAFIDWYRGLACVLMFQTHAYDAWTREPDRQGFWWWMARQQLGGFPARMFLFLAGVSLMMRYASDARRNVPTVTAKLGGVKRGLEVFAIGYAFRIGEWLLGGARPRAAWAILKVDVLQCIGLSLMLTALVSSPKDLRPGRVPILPMLLALTVALGTPVLQHLGQPEMLPKWLSYYLWGGHPLVQFPVLPWVAHTLTGACIGTFWMRAAAADKLDRTMLITGLVGTALAILGQVGEHVDIPIYRTHTPALAHIATPVSYFYRSGMCMVFGALCFLYEKARPIPKLSPLLLLGQASMLVYIVHVDLVYGIWSYPIKHRLNPWQASIGILLLTIAMIWLSWYRIYRFKGFSFLKKNPT